MAVRKIEQLGAECLKKVSEPVNDVNEVKDLIKDLKLHEFHVLLSQFILSSNLHHSLDLLHHIHLLFSSLQ